MTRKLLTVDAFRDAAKGDAKPNGTVIRLATSAPTSVDGAGRTIRFVFSDGTVDRSGDSIDPNGWDLTEFVKNPVALWAHDSDAPPIGRASNIGPVKGKLLGDIEFIPPEISAFADMIFRMVEGGYINAVSVGFMPLEYSFVSEQDRPFGIDFKRQELLEISLCPVPCNPNALIDARAKGIDTAPLREWAEKVLDGGATVMVPRALLEETFRQAKTPRAVRRKYLARADASDWKVGASRDLPIDDADAWDGPAAAKRMLDAAGFDGDNPDAAKAARGFLIHDAANPDLRGSYKLPFADIVGGSLKAVKGGIGAAASRLPQTDAPQAVLDDARKVLDGYEAKMTEDKVAPHGADLAALAKDLNDVSWLASLLQSLAVLADWIEWEAQLEDDGSAIPARVAAIVNELGQILIDMTAEEVAELLAEETDETGGDPMGPLMLAAKTPGQKLLLALGRSALAASATAGKAGRRISGANEALLRTAMDHHESATKCIKDVLASNETAEPDDPEPDLTVPLTEEGKRAQRLREARALREAAKI
jgi:HK97 family phage prohead protease